ACAISGQCGERIITLRDVNSGKVLGRTTFERWGVVTPTQDKLRHVALDVTAAVVGEMGVGNASLTPFTRFTQWRTIRTAKRHTHTSRLSTMLHLFSRVTHRRTVVMRHSLRTGLEELTALRFAILGGDYCTAAAAAAGNSNPRSDGERAGSAN